MMKNELIKRKIRDNHLRIYEKAMPIYVAETRPVYNSQFTSIFRIILVTYGTVA